MSTYMTLEEYASILKVESYVIQGVRGEIYCCKEDIFLETYEPVLERE